MQQFQVPQFITIEDKVIGPFTLKQFAFLGLGSLLVVLSYGLFQPIIFYPVALFIGSISVSLAYLKFNGQPLPTVIINGIKYFLRPRLFVWKRVPAITPNKEQAKKETTVKSIPKLSESKLGDLAWSLDIKSKSK